MADVIQTVRLETVTDEVVTFMFDENPNIASYQVKPETMELMKTKIAEQARKDRVNTMIEQGIEAGKEKKNSGNDNSDTVGLGFTLKGF